MTTELKVVKWNRDTLSASFLSQWFIEFSKDKPWNEYLMCPQCKNFDDYGPAHTYGVKEVTTGLLRACPVCGTKLELFWGPERVMNYLFRNTESNGIVASVDGETAGWCRGYPRDTNCFYIDTVAIMPDFRLRLGMKAFLEEFKKFLEKKRLEGFQRFMTRTHKEAKNVRLILRFLGFREGNPSEDDPDRTYWILD